MARPAAPTPRHHAVIRQLRPNGAVILLGMVCTLAVVELIAATIDYRQRIHEDDWAQVEGLMAGAPEAPLIIASEWLGPSARMHLARARSWDSIAFPDLRGYEHFWLLAHARERPWGGWLEAELEGLPRPEVLEIHQAGDLTLYEYRQEVAPLRVSLLDSIEQVSTERGRCSGRHGAWKCKDGRVAIRTIEVDYRPRRCLAVELDDGAMAEVALGEVEVGAELHGHVGFGDFNARLRADPSARLEVVADDVIIGRWVFTDDQGWAAFALRTGLGPSTHELALRVGTTSAGTWQRDGHRNSPTDTLCVELRGFGEAGSE